jgi:hypothetical protein
LRSRVPGARGAGEPGNSLLSSIDIRGDGGIIEVSGGPAGFEPAGRRTIPTEEGGAEDYAVGNA